MKATGCLWILLLVIGYLFGTAFGEVLEMVVYPPEHIITTDEVTGAKLIYVTSNEAADRNLYFHERSWLPDESLLLFTSSRANGGVMGYLMETGELVQFTTPQGALRFATADAKRQVFYAVRGKEVLEIQPEIVLSKDSSVRSKAAVTVRKICELPNNPSCSLNGNCDGTKLAVGVMPQEGEEHPIYVIDVFSGQCEELCRVPQSIGYGGHVQWSKTNPNLLSFAGRTQRLVVVDYNEKIPKIAYKAQEQELVTHESWWVNDQLMFCGGTHPKPTEDSHVKLLNITTGVVRIIGAGSWWEGATPAELAKVNWWHSAGSDDGRWVAADNWHGDIMLFEGATTRPRLLTQGHRTYGKGEHPHVGWDRKSKAVVFCSEQRGNPDVVIAYIPEEWQRENPS